MYIWTNTTLSYDSEIQSLIKLTFKRFQNCTKGLWSKANAIKAQINNLEKEEGEVNRIYIAQNKYTILATGSQIT